MWSRRRWCGGRITRASLRRIRMLMRPVFWTEEKITPALIAARGMITPAALLLSRTYGRTCHPATVRSAIKRYPRLQQIVDTCMNAVLDICESQVMHRAELGDQKDQHFLLITKGKHRGYNKQQVVTGIGP